MESRDILSRTALTGESLMHQPQSRQCSLADRGVLVAEAGVEDRQLARHRQGLDRVLRDSSLRHGLVFLQ